MSQKAARRMARLPDVDCMPLLYEACKGLTSFFVPFCLLQACYVLDTYLA